MGLLNKLATDNGKKGKSTNIATEAKQYYNENKRFVRSHSVTHFIGKWNRLGISNGDFAKGICCLFAGSGKSFSLITK